MIERKLEIGKKSVVWCSFFRIGWKFEDEKGRSMQLSKCHPNGPFYAVVKKTMGKKKRKGERHEINQQLFFALSVPQFCFWGIGWSALIFFLSKSLFPSKYLLGTKKCFKL